MMACHLFGMKPLSKQMQLFNLLCLSHIQYSMKKSFNIQLLSFMKINNLCFYTWMGRAALWASLVLLSSLRWRHNDHAGVSNHQPHGCLLNRLFRRKSKKTSKLRVTGLCVGNSPGTGEFPARMASYAENVSIWWRHHADTVSCIPITATHLKMGHL